MTSPNPLPGLAQLQGLRSAPDLDPDQIRQLREELVPLLQACQWFTIGVMAPTVEQALATLRRCEAALGWPPLRRSDGDGTPLEGSAGPVFLKGNQRNGTCWIRQEAGLGQGVLITGHHPDHPEREDTWGPLPLNLFADAIS